MSDFAWRRLGDDDRHGRRATRSSMTRRSATRRTTAWISSLGPTDSRGVRRDGTPGAARRSASVRAALDAHAGRTGIDHSAAYQKARTSLAGRSARDHVHQTGRGYLAMFERHGAALDPGHVGHRCRALARGIPEWMIAGRARRGRRRSSLDAVVAAPRCPRRGESGSVAAAHPAGARERASCRSPPRHARVRRGPGHRRRARRT